MPEWRQHERRPAQACRDHTRSSPAASKGATCHNGYSVATIVIGVNLSAMVPELAATSKLHTPEAQV